MPDIQLIAPDGRTVSADTEYAKQLVTQGYEVAPGQVFDSTTGPGGVIADEESLTEGGLGSLGSSGNYGTESLNDAVERFGEERASTWDAFAGGIGNAASIGLLGMLESKVREKHGETPLEKAKRDAESGTRTAFDIGGTVGMALLSGGTSLAVKGGASAGKVVAKQMVGEAVESSAKLAAKSTAKSAGDALARTTLPGAFARTGEKVMARGLAKGHSHVRAGLTAGVVEGSMYGATRLAGEVLIGDQDLTADLIVGELGGNALLGGAFGAAGGAIMGKVARMKAANKFADPLADKSTRSALIAKAQDKFAANINKARAAGLGDDIARVERNLGIDDISDFGQVLKKLDSLDADDAGIVLRSLDNVELAGASAGQLTLGQDFIEPGMLAKSDIADDVLDALIKGKRTPEIDMQFKAAADELTQFLGMGELKTDLARTLAAQYTIRNITKNAVEGAAKGAEKAATSGGKQGILGKLFGEAKAEAVTRPVTKKATSTAANAAGEIAGGPGSYGGRKASAKAAGWTLGLLKALSPVNAAKTVSGGLAKRAALTLDAVRPSQRVGLLRAIDDAHIGLGDFLDGGGAPEAEYLPKTKKKKLTPAKKVEQIATKIRGEAARAKANPQYLENRVASDNAELIGLYPRLLSSLVSTEQRKLQYLDSVAPKVIKHPAASAAGGSRGGVSDYEVQKYGRALRGVNFPLDVLTDLAHGELDLEALAAVKTVYPNVYADFHMNFMLALQERTTPVPYERRKLYSLAFEEPFDDLFEPRGVQVLQDSATANAYAQAATEINGAQSQQGQQQQQQPTHGNAKPLSGAAAQGVSKVASSMKVQSDIAKEAI